jgi:hypothetical protein
VLAASISVGTKEGDCANSSAAGVDMKIASVLRSARRAELRIIELTFAS